MKQRIAAMLAALAMLLTGSELPAIAEESLPDSGDLIWEPMPPEEEDFRADGLIFTIYTPNQYTEVVKDKYAYVAGVEEGVTSVTIPAEADGVPVEGILDAALKSADLQEILVVEEQTHFSSVDGVLFNKAGDTLAAYPLGRTGAYAVPDGTKCIGSYALSAPEGYDGLTEITFPETLVEIMDHAFENQCGLTKIVLPDSCKYVKEYAFSNCRNVTSIHLGKQLGTFFKPCGGCTSLCEITGSPSNFHILDNVLYTSSGNQLVLYPAGLTAERYVIPANTIGLWAGSFADNPYLKQVEISPTVVSVNDTFLNMDALESLTFPEGVASLDGTVANHCPSLKTVCLPKTLNYTGYSYTNGTAGFLGRTPALTDVYYNGLEPEFEKITNITRNKNIYRSGVNLHFSDEDTYETFFVGDKENGGFTYKVYEDHAEVAGYTFGTKRPRDLKKVIEVSAEVEGLPVTTVGRKAFTGLANVGGLVLPDSIRFIQEQAFQGALVEVNIPKNVESIGDSAFFGANFQTVTLPGKLKKMGKNVFRQSHVREVIVEEGVTEIGDCAFLECSKLTSVQFPSTLAGIRGSAFSLTKSLESVKLPYGLAWIGDRAFNGSGIRRVNLPNTLKKLGAYAFCNCENLTSVTIPPQITDLSEGVFSGSGLKDVTVPATVKQIENGSFRGCRQLRRITILNPACHFYDSGDVICTGYEVSDMTAPEQGHEVTAPEPVITYDLTICGYVDSTAQEYADAHSIPFELYDPNAYDVTDVVSVQRFLLGEGTSVSRRSYDFNDDGVIDVYDLALLKRKLTAN